MLSLLASLWSTVNDRSLFTKQNSYATNLDINGTTILLSTDLSENSKEAFSYAKNLAVKYNAKLYLTAVIQDPAELALFSVIEQPNLILEDIKPTLDETKQINEVSSRIIGYLQGLCDSKNLNAEVALVGSVAKNTALKGKSDIDIFIAFPLDTDKNILKDKA